ncbi:MAG: hypothetical protein MK081_13980 [Flavobacteriales bacterium]|uniref:hypothetical protein n=1 Tax=Sanyastnella coralliicola TaxID=3069118 RepID=UPI0027BADE27|nr:hypothetical protein [Longitalea sp. SCSIO 12813]MCH2199883.1 hypothetical protein [Flavobacteriales bacterium]
MKNSTFYNLYFTNLTKSKSQQEAYEKTEEQHVEQYKRRKYSNFNSFRSARDRFLNARRR